MYQSTRALCMRTTMPRPASNHNANEMASGISKYWMATAASDSAHADADQHEERAAHAEARIQQLVMEMRAIGLERRAALAACGACVVHSSSYSGIATTHNVVVGLSLRPAPPAKR